MILLSHLRNSQSVPGIGLSIRHSSLCIRAKLDDISITDTVLTSYFSSSSQRLTDSFSGLLQRRTACLSATLNRISDNLEVKGSKSNCSLFDCIGGGGIFQL